MSGTELIVELEPELLRWSRERASLTVGQLAENMGIEVTDIHQWEESGNIKMKDAEELARVTYTPFGYLFLSEPPDESLPMQDLRATVQGLPERPSPNLIACIYAMQRRQAWMSQVMQPELQRPLSFVRPLGPGSSHQELCERIRHTLFRERHLTTNALLESQHLDNLLESIMCAGILPVVSKIVPGHPDRRLNPREFVGFTLVDEYAPLIFVNAERGARITAFMLIHGLAHIMMAESGLCGNPGKVPSTYDAEARCTYATLNVIGMNQDALPFEMAGEQAWEDDHCSELLWQTGGRHFALSVFAAVKESRMTYTEGYSLTGLSGDDFEQIPRLTETD